MRSVLMSVLCVAAIAVVQATTTLKYKPNMRLKPFTWVPTVNYSIVHGATVSIEDGFAAGDQLLFDYQGEFRLQNYFNRTSGILYISGTATLSEYSNAIQDVVFTTTATDGGQRRITWAFGDRTLYLTSTQHYYQAFADRSISWYNAMINCQSKTFMGLQGYLATITSQAEMDALSRKMNMSVWIGATLTNGNWSWVTGPEQQTQFWSGPNMYKGGFPLPWTYNAWGRFQPSDEKSTRIYAALQPSSLDLTASWKNYDNSAGVQGYLCEFGGLNWTDPSVPDTYHDSVVLDYSCSLFTTSDECASNKNYGCSWSGSSCGQSRCRRYQSEVDCNGDPSCDWNTDGNIGVCANTECSQYASDEATCTADISCKWTIINDAKTCVKAMCTDMSSSCMCTALSATDCVWRWGKCNNRAGLNCDNMDIVYVLDGSAAMAQPFGLNQQGFAALTGIFADTEQVLTGSRGGVSPGTAKGQRVGFVVTGRTLADSVVPANIGSGGKLTGSRAEKLSDLQYLTLNYAASADTSISTALTAAANMFTSSNGGVRRKVVIIISAANISDVAVAKSGPMAALTQAGATVLAAKLLPTPVFNAAQMVEESYLVDLLGTVNIVITPIDGVASRIIYGACDTAHTFGQALNPPVVQTCWSYMNKSTCRADATCAWSDSGNQCVRSQCQTYCGQTDCNADSTCNWDSSNNVCSEKCASQSAAACDATYCTVDNGACVSKPCFNNPTEDSCIADPANCFYNASAQISCQPVTCPMQTTNGACTGLGGCKWVESRQLCIADPCSTRPFGICTQLPQCTWGPVNGSLNACMLAAPCAELQKENDCANNFNCMWDTTTTPAICAPAPCVKYNSQPDTAMSRCSQNSNCMWRTAAQTGTAARCEVKTCEMLTQSCDCAKADACVWREGMCRDVRYVMCPAVDVFFLVEGTTRMMADFGRHPDGFLGLTESLRAWSRAAPWAPDAMSAGFRMGMALYGANSAFTVPEAGTPGNGTKFVNNGPSWFDAQGVLNFMQQKVTSYATGAGAETALRPGLTAAQDMFKNSAPNRKKVLVILGASPITDGKTNETSLGPLIADLELAGVTIFSNIIRRFNSIAPVEQVASMYMQPIATEPSSAYFLFATIDNIRESLLDNFCDPSSVAGQLLSVNRNDTLPCNWLGKSECNMQSSCLWNPTGNVTCPLAGQCPNLDCQALPSVLAAKFNCSHCRLVSGAFQCSYGKNFVPAVGICAASPCSMAYCDSTTCMANTSCTYEPSMGRCGQNICGTPSTNTAATCNSQFGCYWNSLSTTTAASCVRSNSWRYRTELTCTAYTELVNGDQLAMYRWYTNTTPAVCMQKRCENYGTESECNASAVTGCFWNPSSSTGRYCQLRECPYTTSIDCQADTNCYWNPYDTIQGECKQVPPDGSCVLSKFSDWSPCTATCGNAIQFKRRRILRFPTDAKGARSCATVAADLSASEPEIVQSRSCGVPSNCTTYCAAYNNSVACSRDISCNFNLTCQPVRLRSCNELNTEALCSTNSGVCKWNSVTSFCDEVVTKCTIFNTSDQCMDAIACTWRTGVKANTYAASLGFPVQLYNPGEAQQPIFAFPQLLESQNDIVMGGTVTIEKFYQRGKDHLELLYPSAIATQWDPTSGTLHLWGRGTVSDYINAIRFVTFRTTATRTNPRLISWSLNTTTVYSGVTGHWYRYYNTTGLTWAEAQAQCQRSKFWGRGGYLAVITSAEENELVASKLGASGWLGGDDVTTGVWRWANGPFASSPLQFWEGQSSILGGHVLPNMYANWDSLNNEPLANLIANANHISMNDVGYWTSKNGDWTGAKGFVCEYGDLPGDSPTLLGGQAMAVGGSAVIGLGGCIPQTCTWHTSASDCEIDPECRWTGNQCVMSCYSQSSPAECAAMANCKWDTTVLPPICSANPCTTMNQTDCDKSSASATGKCTWSSQFGCMFKTGCATRNSQASCAAVPSCAWSMADGLCTNKACTSLNTEAACTLNPLCIYGSSGCVSAMCRAGNKDQCRSDPQCAWSEGNEAVVAFTVGGERVRPFATGLNPPSTIAAQTVDGATIMITRGFQMGYDQLSVNQSALDAAGFAQPDLNMAKETGVLVLVAPPNMGAYDMFLFIVKNVYFTSTAKTDLARTVAYSLGANMIYSSSLNKYIKYVPAPAGRAGASTYAAASAICGASSFFGNTGSLAMFVDEMDTLNAARFQPNAWIGAQASTTNQWVWAAAPSQVFWDNGNSNLGPVTTSNNQTVFAFWAAGQPKNVATGMMYGFMTPTGRWKSVVDGQSFQGAGVMCMFDRVIANGVQATKQVQAQGCFVKPCITLTESQCVADATCQWSSIARTCSAQDFCPKALTPSLCSGLANCFWDFNQGVCSRMDPTICTGLTQVKCSNKTAYPTCMWTNLTAEGSNSNGACIMTGCTFRTKASCSGDSSCMWAASTSGLGEGQCIRKNCGLPTPGTCFADPRCEWSTSENLCKPSGCLQEKTSTTCNAKDSCSWTGTACQHARCRTTAGSPTCMTDPDCFYDTSSGSCTRPTCTNISGEANCNKNPLCFFEYKEPADDSTCIVAQCVSFKSQAACQGGQDSQSGRTCRWEGGACRELTNAERRAPASVNACTKEVSPSLWWLWLLLGVIALLLLGIVYRLYLAYAKGLSFFEPTRTNVKYSPHQQYAEDLFEEAQQTAVETNTSNYQKPNINDL